jgi:hypothetical protein
MLTVENNVFVFMRGHHDCEDTDVHASLDISRGEKSTMTQIGRSNSRHPGCLEGRDKLPS